MTDKNYTQTQAEDYNDDINQLGFMMRTALSQVRTTIPAKVIKVYTVGIDVYVDVQPLINQVTGNGTGKNHGTIFGIPVWRLQGGIAAIIITPVAGDIGLLSCSDRDISVFKKTKTLANPASKRRFDLADSIYIGGVLNQAPTHYIEVTQTGINIVGNVTITGTVTANGHSIDETHKHTGVTSGSSQTGTVV